MSDAVMLMEPFMPTVSLAPETLVKVAGGEVVTWAECQRRLAASTPVGGWQEADEQDVLDTISDAIGDSMDLDWTYSIGAKAIVEAFKREGWTVSAPPPPSVSIDNGSRPQEAVPTCDAKPAVVAHSTYLSAVAGRMAFRDAYRRCLPVVQAAEALAAKWTREGQKVDSDDFYAAINDVWEAVAKRNGDPLAKDDGAYAATPQPADGCSSNEGADA